MRRITILVLFMAWAVPSFGQDLIVTDEGDSINCRISKVKSDMIYFTFKYEDEYRSTLLPLTRVKHHQFDYYQSSEVPEDKVVGFNNYQVFRLAFNGGYSYRTASIPEDLPMNQEEYYKGLKSGYHWGGEIIFYFTEPMGIGFKYYQSYSSNSADGFYIEDSQGNGMLTSMSEAVQISFIGPTYSTRFVSHNKRNSLFLNYSLGYLGYRNKVETFDDFSITGSTLGMAFDLGYDIGITENLKIGFQVSLIGGTLTKYDIIYGYSSTTVELEQDQYEGLGRFDFSVGIRYSK